MRSAVTAYGAWVAKVTSASRVVCSFTRNVTASSNSLAASNRWVFVLFTCSYDTIKTDTSLYNLYVSSFMGFESFYKSYFMHILPCLQPSPSQHVQTPQQQEHAPEVPSPKVNNEKEPSQVRRCLATVCLATPTLCTLPRLSVRVSSF